MRLIPERFPQYWHRKVQFACKHPAMSYYILVFECTIYAFVFFYLTDRYIFHHEEAFLGRMLISLICGLMMAHHTQRSLEIEGHEEK